MVLIIFTRLYLQSDLFDDENMPNYEQIALVMGVELYDPWPVQATTTLNQPVNLAILPLQPLPGVQHAAQTPPAPSTTLDMDRPTTPPVLGGPQEGTGPAPSTAINVDEAVTPSVNLCKCTFCTTIITYHTFCNY